MNIYKNLSGRSNVSHYEIGSEHIDVRFLTTSKDGSNTYKYTYESAAQGNVEHMKKLATTGMGLNTFINQNVRKNYSRKWYTNA